MPTYLLTWQPKRSPWNDFEEASERTASGSPHEMRWSTGNRKTVNPGDRLFLLKQGKEPKGIIAAGWAIGSCYEAPHWDAEHGGTCLYVDGSYDRILNPAKETPLSVAEFTSSALAEVPWNTQASGVEIPELAAELLEEAWEEHLQSLGNGKATRNPAWARDELILALDLYLRFRPKLPGPSHPDVIALSDLLNALPIHGSTRGNTKFRNPNGVGMKLANFQSIDPDAAKSGRLGLRAGNKLERAIWDQFANNPTELGRVADGIRQGYSLLAPDQPEEDDEETFPEGRVLYRLHRQRERNRAVIEKAKQVAKRKNGGRLFCCVCTFDFAATYGPLGEDYIEGHHSKPLADLKGTTETKVPDIALVCSNCHRMLHRKRPWLTVEELGKLIAK